MAVKADYYEVLGVPKDAEGKAIKSAYRKLAMKYHPDRNQGDASAEAKFKGAAEAYDVLGDKEKRAQYDRFGHQAFAGGGGGGGQGSPVWRISSAHSETSSVAAEAGAEASATCSAVAVRANAARYVGATCAFLWSSP